MERGRDTVTDEVIGAAIAVHRCLGPGLLESVYATCLRYELAKRGVAYRADVRLPVLYDGRTTERHLTLDLLIRECVVVELKSVERLLPVHKAQLITYLRLSGFTRGLLINFNVPRVIDGIVRLVNRYGATLCALCASV